MKIYRISGSFDGGIHAHFTRTKAEAEKYVKSFSNLDTQYDLDIEVEEIDPTRAGVVEFLNYFLMLTCFNEGG